MRLSWLHRAKCEHCCCPQCKNGESVVHDGLSYSVSEMAKAVAQGKAVNLGNAALQPNQGQANPSWDIPLEERRGTDIADIYQAQQEAREKVRCAGIAAKKKAKEAQNTQCE